MSPSIFSRRIFRKWRFPKHVNSKDSRNTDREPSQLEECSALPVKLDNPIINDDQAVLQDQVKPENYATTTTISHFALLPFELFQHIIDNLSDDQAALRACSLTCRAFLPASRYHIFHSIHLGGKQQTERFLDTICFTNSPTSPCMYVRYLCMSEGEGCIRVSPFVNETLPLLATHLLNVTELDVRDLSWTLLNDSARAKILAGFQMVQKITIRAFFETSRQANEFISSFPSLMTLTCWETGWNLHSEPAIPLPSSLKFIALRSSQTHFFERCLRLESHPNVSTIFFRGMHLEDAQATNELLKTLGSRLKHLQLIGIDAACMNVRVIDGIFINLTHNTELCSVGLQIPNDSPTLDWMSTFFSQIASPHVKYVSLLLTLRTISRLEEMAWASIENLFTQPRWSNLRLLEIVVFGKPVAPQSIKAHLPILDGRGIVNVTDWYNRSLVNPQVFSDGF